ncbi:flavodoxin [Levilactobacillus tujiorum]|uniref:Flavodoxin n=1 Tax=Levilactobacillus tujiorum TaxID=2912243 RepID=A0ABX1L698_9LACO|nr:flavodoxin [Levilactobacillus tujiorum]MCH5464793.1 flavodoxin [Levilactobacillus tujiorum]NLR11909.1 flavodoxin [Lactobacillus sp. HBUAS51387]NLR29829.1 flavodoxin [Levilactobacillus tujiorum]
MAENVLIVAYSWSGHTAQLATAIQRTTGADRLDLTVAAGMFPDDMYATADVANQQLASDQLPTLTSEWPRLDQYQLLLIGGPVWSAKVATPVRSFLQQLQGYRGTVAPFYTDAGTPGEYEADFAKLVPNLPVATGLGVAASELAQADQAVAKWWQKLSNK